MIGIIKHTLREIFTPSYDEKTIFLICYVFILLFTFDNDCRDSIIKFYSRPTSGEARVIIFKYFVSIMFLCGLIASFFQAFTRGEKSSTSEILMKFSALTINGIAGIAGGLYVLNNEINFIIAFPVYNIIMGVALLYQIGLAEDIPFDQTDASLSEIILGIIACTSLFLVCTKIFELYWAISFSICVNYATSINNLVTQTPNALKTRLLNLQKG